MNKLLIVCGPTATGKTALALGFAKKYNGELISADSRQVYRGMDIGTGKDISKQVTINNLQLTINFKNKNFQLKPYSVNGIPLWMYDVVNPNEEFSVAHYQHLAAEVIENIRKRRKLPIVVGGTGLYITSLLSPLETSHIPPHQLLRNTLAEMNIKELQERLQKDNPRLWDEMNSSDRQNPRRLMRKIEIAEYERYKPACRQAGIQSNKEITNDNALVIGLTAPYRILYKRIDERVEKRVKEGIVGEIQTLLKCGHTWDLPSMNTFGYKEWKYYFELSAVSCQLSDMKRSIIQRWKWDEHGYARRQMTWFRRMKGIQWVDISSPIWQRKVEELIDSWYTK